MAAATQELNVLVEPALDDCQGLFSSWDIPEITAHAVGLAARHVRAAVGLLPFTGLENERLRRPGGGQHRRPGGRHRGRHEM